MNSFHLINVKKSKNQEKLQGKIKEADRKKENTLTTVEYTIPINKR